MPAWGQSEGGPLNEFQIFQLVSLITTAGHGDNPEVFWDHVEEHWHETNPGLAEPEIPTGLTVNQAACGQSAGTPTPTPDGTATATATPSGTAEPPQTSFTVVATDNAFDLTSLSVPVGQEVTINFQNQGAAIHNLHVPDLNVVGQPLPGGQSETLTFTAADGGTFNFLCDFHPAEMTGTITAQ
jgi:plastocyanin